MSALTAIFRIPKVWTWFSSSQLDVLAFSSLLAKILYESPPNLQVFVNGL